MLKIGHRGARAYAPENTLPSLTRAVMAGADLVEFDVRLTADKFPVVIHDRLLARLAQRFRRVSRLPLAELQQLRVEGERIPTLAEALGAVPAHAGVNIHIKHRGCAPWVIAELRSLSFDRTRVLISADLASELRAVERLEPTIRTCLFFQTTNWLSFRWPLHMVVGQLPLLGRRYLRWAGRRSGADFLNIYHRHLSQAKVAWLHAQGLGVLAWTVNRPQRIERMKQAGVDGITSDYPDRL